MISSNSHKALFSVILALMLSASCSFFRGNSDENLIQKSDNEILTSIPFSTKELETFQTEIIVKTFINEKTNEQKYFIAKSGNKSLKTFGVGNENERSILQIDEENVYLINHNSNTYKKLTNKISTSFSDDSLIKTLTSKWLNERRTSNFEKLETKDGIAKYLIKTDKSKNTDIILFVDEKLGIPIKNEFYHTTKGDKSLTYSIELKNLNIETEENLFELPKDYKKID